MPTTQATRPRTGVAAEDRERIGRLETQVSSIAGDVSRIEHTMTDGFNRISVAIEGIQASRQVNWGLIGTVIFGMIGGLGTAGGLFFVFVSMSLRPNEIALDHLVDYQQRIESQVNNVSELIAHEIQQYDEKQTERLLARNSLIQSLEDRVAATEESLNNRSDFMERSERDRATFMERVPPGAMLEMQKDIARLDAIMAERRQSQVAE